MEVWQHNAALNDALIALRHSLLQYAGEAWPWSDPATDADYRTVRELVERQESYVARIAELLVARHWTIDFGMYPAEYTDLHYVALDYMLRLLVESESVVLNVIEETLRQCADDIEAYRLLQDAATDQREIVARLRSLAESRRETAAAATGA